MSQLDINKVESSDSVSEEDESPHDKFKIEN